MENILVAAKILLLVVFGIGGILYALVASSDPVRLGFSRFTPFSPIMAAAVSFVAF